MAAWAAKVEVLIRENLYAHGIVAHDVLSQNFHCAEQRRPRRRIFMEEVSREQYKVDTEFLGLREHLFKRKERVHPANGMFLVESN